MTDEDAKRWAFAQALAEGAAAVVDARLFATINGKLLLTSESEEAIVAAVIKLNGYATVLTPTFPTRKKGP